MKILSVCFSIPRDDAASLRISNIVKILRANGHEVDIVHYTKRSSYEKLENKERYEHDTFVMASMPTVHLKHLRSLRRGDYDLVYGNTHGSAFCSLLGRLTKTPLIFDMHGGLIEEFLLEHGSNFSTKISPKFFLKKFIDFTDIYFSNKIICVSNKMIEYLHGQKSVPLEKMAYVTNGVDLGFFKPVDNEKVENTRNQLGIEDKLVFGYIGGFDKWQGVRNFLEAARKIDDNEIAFLIVGGEKESKEKNIIFNPKVSHTQIPDYYSICDVLVLPRPSHPATEIAAPTKFAEYAAMGKPILTTNVGDAADFVREYECGIVVEDNVPRNLIKGINKFKDKSPKEMEIMGKNSRRLAENEFDWDTVGINLLKAVELLQ